LRKRWQFITEVNNMVLTGRNLFFIKTLSIIFIILIATIAVTWYLWTADTAYLDETSLKDDESKNMGSWDFYSGNYSNKSLIGNSLPGTWRPYLADSPWNTVISDTALIHPDSEKLMAVVIEEASHLRLVKYYNSPIWVVNSKNMPKYRVNSKKIFDWWDKDKDNWTDVEIPISPIMWTEGTEDGHMTIIDPFIMTAWEMSRFKWKKTAKGFIPTSTTFNVWDLKGKGYAEPLEGKRWHQRGGRGSGFPILAGLIRPEELAQGEIRHALMFNFSKVRQSENGDNELFISPPASRSDGDFIGDQYLIEGMRLQLNPALTDADFNRWGLNREGKIIAKALQRYGMYLGDSGGAMSLGIQQLAKTKKENLKKWDILFPGLYRSVKKIPTRELRVIFTALPRDE